MKERLSAPEFQIRAMILWDFPIVGHMPNGLGSVAIRASVPDFNAAISLDTSR
jgi:hypothetical protein